MLNPTVRRGWGCQFGCTLPPHAITFEIDPDIYITSHALWDMVAVDHLATPQTSARSCSIQEKSSAQPNWVRKSSRVIYRNLCFHHPQRILYLNFTHPGLSNIIKDFSNIVNSSFYKLKLYVPLYMPQQRLYWRTVHQAYKSMCMNG